MSVVYVGLDTVLGDAVLSLVDSGIDEGAHFWGRAWDELDNDDIEFALNNSATFSKMIEYIRLPLVEKLKGTLEDRKKHK